MTNTDIIKYSVFAVVIGGVAYFVLRAGQGAAQAGTSAANSLGQDLQDVGAIFTGAENFGKSALNAIFPIGSLISGIGSSTASDSSGASDPSNNADLSSDNNSGLFNTTQDQVAL